MRLQDLPVDCLHRIIRYAVPTSYKRRDETLLSLALLSKSFAQASQVALLQQLDLVGHLNMIELVDTIANCYKVRSICHSTTSLRLNCYSLNDKESVWTTEEIVKRLPAVKMVWFEQVTSNLITLSLATGLTNLSLYHVDFMIDAPTQHGLYKPFLPCLTHLSLKRVSLYTSLHRDNAVNLDFLLNAQSLPSLSHLSITYEPSSPPTFITLCAQLSHLRLIRTVGYSPLPELELARLSSTNHLMHLSLDLRAPQDIDLLLSHPLPDTLRSLQITRGKSMDMERKLLSFVTPPSKDFRWLIVDSLDEGDNKAHDKRTKGDQMVRRANVVEAEKWGIKVFEIDGERSVDGETWFKYTAALDRLAKSQEEQTHQEDQVKQE